jgi:hypothetical protein
MTNLDWEKSMLVDGKTSGWYILIFDLPYFTQQFLFTKSPLSVSMFGTMYRFGFNIVLISSLVVYCIAIYRQQAFPKTVRFICLYTIATMIVQLIGVLLYLNI